MRCGVRFHFVIAGLDTASRGLPDLRRSILRNSGRPEFHTIHLLRKMFSRRWMDPRVKPAGDNVGGNPGDKQ